MQLPSYRRKPGSNNFSRLQKVWPPVFAGMTNFVRGPMNTLIKIYGERNTNTNYLSQLIKLNLDAYEIPGVVPPTIMSLQEILPGKELVRDIYFKLTYGRNLGWKHSRVKPIYILKRYSIVRNNNIAFITITKNPYSWALSLYRNPYHQYYSKKLNFETFLRTPWKTVDRDNTKRWLSNPIELWNIKNSSYLQLSELNALNITTESIFVNPETAIEKIYKTFSIRKISDVFVNYEKSTKEKIKDFNYYKNYYLNEKWRDELSMDAISIINEAVDKTLMSNFGYKVLP